MSGLERAGQMAPRGRIDRADDSRGTQSFARDRQPVLPARVAFENQPPALALVTAKVSSGFVLAPGAAETRPVKTRSSEAHVRAAYGRLSDVAFDFLMGEPARSEKEFAAVLRQLGTLLGSAQGTTDLKHFGRMSPGNAGDLWQSIGMPRGEELANPTPAERALLTTVYARLAGGLGQMVMPSIPIIILTLGASARRSTALGNLSFWTGTEVVTGKGWDDFKASHGVDASQAQKDMEYVGGLYRRYQLHAPVTRAASLAELPSESVNFALVASFTPEVLFGGERVYGGRINGELMRASWRDLLQKLEEEDAVALYRQRASRPSSAGQEGVWAIRNLLVIEQGSRLLLSMHQAQGSRRYSPQEVERLTRLQNSAARALGEVRGAHPSRVAAASGFIDRVFEVLREKAAELTDG